jgi:hypothetical protein
LTRLFEKIPEDLFAPLSRKYKSIYAFALISLYHLLRLYKTDIKKTDYSNLLKSQGEEILSLFNVETDRLDDHDDIEKIDAESTIPLDNTEALLSQKVNYIIRKLSRCGWFIISKNPKNNVEYVYIPAYSIQLLKIMDDLTSDIGSYLPLVHQTYAELKMEDEKEDDYMYRSLLNARQNADSIEMSVVLLRQQICVFGNRLTSVLDPNQALKQHFDEYRVDISDKYYHPMKTFDSLGLYSQPTIKLLSNWLKSERIITLLVREAKTEPLNRTVEEATIAKNVIKTIQEVIDIFSRLTSSFNEIDSANANYTEAVQRKVNYLSSNDKTVKGKIDRIILALANEIKNNPALKYEEMPLLEKASDSISFYRQGYVDSSSLTMPFRRGEIEEGEPLPLEDEIPFDEQTELMNQVFDNELNRFSDRAITEFIEENMQGKDEITTYDVNIYSTDQLVLMILGILKANLGIIPYVATKLEDRIDYDGYYMPLYKFTRRNKSVR